MAKHLPAYSTAADAVKHPEFARARLRTGFGRTGTTVFSGYAFDPGDSTRRYVVQLFVDGIPLQVAVADQYDDTLADEAAGDSCHGFSFVVAAEILADAHVVEVRLANSGEPVGDPVRLHDGRAPVHEQPGLRGARWIGGLRFCGWLEGDTEDAPKVAALIDGMPVQEAVARSWHQVGGRGDEARAVPAFDLHLPARFADGRVRSVRIVDEAGEDLPGSPLTFVAFDNGLERTLSKLAQLDSEKLRGALFDRLIPASLPLSQYSAWLERFPPAESCASGKGPVAIVFAGRGDETPSIASLDEQTHSSWVGATLPSELEAGFDPEHLRHFLAEAGADCGVIVFALNGMRLDRTAVEALTGACESHPEAVAVYADLCVLSASGESWPIFLPAFDYERMLEQGCGAYLFAAKRQQVDRALAAAPGSLFRLFNALVGDPASAQGRVVHLPGALGLLPERVLDDAAAVLAAATSDHLQSRGVAADIVAQEASAAAGSMFPAGVFPSVHVRRHAVAQSVSIIVPTRNHVGLLRRCLETIAPAAARVGAEIIVVDNDSSDPETLDYLAAIDGEDARVLRLPGVFNFARLNNAAVAHATGDHLCLLNNDVEALDELWLDEMLSRIAEPDIGAVGATLLWPSGVIQHAGVVMGPNLGAVHAFTDRMDGNCGYADALWCARECSAVTAACLLTRKSDYLAVGGMDEVFFPVNFNDVDYCLKLRALGRRIVVTPHARLLHLESVSRGSDQGSDRIGRMNRELRTLRARWLETIVNDPYYSPLLSLDSIPFSALAWPPRDCSARINRPPQAVAVPLGM